MVITSHGINATFIIKWNLKDKIHLLTDTFPSGSTTDRQKEKAESQKSEGTEDGSVTSRLHQDFSDDAVMV